MKKYNILCLFLIILLITIFLFVLHNITLCTTSSDSYESIYESVVQEIDPEKNDVCILNYDYVTGTGWKVEKSTNNALIGTYVLLDSAFNPRDLKINKDFELDYFAKFVVVIDKEKKQMTVDNQDTCIIKAKEIIITDNSENTFCKKIKFYDLTLVGKLKSMIAFFLPKYRIHS